MPLDEIARRAGVGAGTVYRHFPTKEALFEAAILDRVERIITLARELATAADPGGAFFDFLARLVAEGSMKRDLADAVGGPDSAEYLRPVHELSAAIDVLLTRAQRAEAVRTDIAVDDLMRIIKGAFLATRGPGTTPAQRERTFAVVFDGLRTR